MRAVTIEHFPSLKCHIYTQENIQLESKIQSDVIVRTNLNLRDQNKANERENTYWCIEVIRHTKALFLAHLLKTTTAPMHSVLGQKEDYRQD